MFLYLTAVLENVQSLDFKNSIEDPYEFSFQLQCTKCKEIHKSFVNFNIFEKHAIADSKGEAAFIASCHFCKAKGNINITQPKGYKGYTSSEERTKMLEIQSRGWEIIDFKPTDPMVVVSESNTRFNDVDLSDAEWYDYDDNAGSEISITEVKWEISN